MAQEEAITFVMEEIETDNPVHFLWTDDFLHDNPSFIHDQHNTLSIFYDENYTVKELMLICEYYGLAKELRTNKCIKTQIVDSIARFETNPANMNIVHRRQNMWFYMNELRSDKFMKKFLLW